MSDAHDPLRGLVCGWAADVADREIIRLSPAMLRAKHLLAREDRRRRRGRRLQAAAVTLPLVLLVTALRPWSSVPALADRLAAAPLPAALAAAAGTVCLVAYVAATWAAE